MKVKLAITQVTSGLEYKGTLSLNKKIFLFILCFGVHIDKLDEQVVPTEEEQAIKRGRELFQFNLKHSDQEVPIDDQLFKFLLGLVGFNVIAFYNDPQSKGINESSVCGQLLDSTSELSSIMGGTISISIGNEKEFKIPDGEIPVSLQA